MKKNTIYSFAFLLLFALINVSPLQASHDTDYTVVGNSPAAIQATVDAFRAALGELNPPNPGHQEDGRRQINWDAAPDAVSAPNSFPGNFFNADFSPRARGAEFTTPGTGFQLSATAASGVGVEFSNIDPSYNSEFQPFSLERLFSPLGSNLVDVYFFIPGTNIPALTDGFGAVFTDVELWNMSKLDYYDQYNNLIHTLFVPASSNYSLSFAGATFTDFEVARVRITLGNANLAWGQLDYPYSPYDLVVLDDFIYGEPQPALATDFQANTDATVSTQVAAFKAALGTANAPEPVNNADGHRSINWDAAPDAVSAPNDFPGDFFNTDFSPRARGASFQVSSTEGRQSSVVPRLQLSATAASGQGINFSNIDASYASQFAPFSTERLFSPIESNIVEVAFFNPVTPTEAALVDGLGVVFSDVETAGSTRMDFYNPYHQLIHTIFVQANTNSSGLSFAGATFPSAIVAKVIIQSGNAPLAYQTLDDPDNGTDLAVMDDFIFGEPTVITCFDDLTSYEIGSYIGTGTYQVSSEIWSNGSVEDDAIVVFKAGYSINLDPGFSVELGSDFHALIEYCQAPLSGPDNNAVPTRLETSSSMIASPASFQFKVYPNPLVGQAQIDFQLLEEQEVSLYLFDQSGRLVTELLAPQIRAAGKYTELINDEKLYSGLFYVSLKTSTNLLVQKLMVIK